MQLERFCISVRKDVFVNFIPDLMRLHTSNNAWKHRVWERCEEPRVQKRILLFPSNKHHFFRNIGVIFIAKISRRNFRINEKMMKLMSMDNTFDMMFPWLEVVFVEFESYLLRGGFKNVLWIELRHQWRFTRHVLCGICKILIGSHDRKSNLSSGYHIRNREKKAEWKREERESLLWIEEC